MAEARSLVTSNCTRREFKPKRWSLHMRTGVYTMSCREVSFQRCWTVKQLQKPNDRLGCWYITCKHTHTHIYVYIYTHFTYVISVDLHGFTIDVTRSSKALNVFDLYLSLHGPGVWPATASSGCGRGSPNAVKLVGYHCNSGIFGNIMVI